MLQKVFFLIIFSIITLTAQSATSLRADSFYIEQSTQNNSGELTFQAYKKILLIHSEISVPIEYRNSAAFKINQAPSGNGPWGNFPENGPWGQPSEVADAKYRYGKSGSWAGVSLEEADFNGDGLTDLLARTSLINAKVFIIYGSTGTRPTRVDYLSGTEISSSTTIKDFDGDGKDEIAVSSNGQIHTVYDVSGSNGSLTLTKNTTIDYRQFSLGDYLGYHPKAASLVAPNRLNSSVNYVNGSLNVGIPALLPKSYGQMPQLSFVNTNSTNCKNRAGKCI
jgi:hypothetical protein